MSYFPALKPEFADRPTLAKLAPADISAHPPRILLLYGSLRERSYSKLLTLEAQRILERMGAETRISIPPACRCPMRPPPTIPRCRNFASCHCGPRDRSGPVPSAMGRSPAS